MILKVPWYLLALDVVSCLEAATSQRGKEQFSSVIFFDNDPGNPLALIPVSQMAIHLLGTEETQSGLRLRPPIWTDIPRLE